MEKTSVIIPSRNEVLLSATVENLYKNAVGEIEIIVILDGPTDYPVPDNVKVIKKEVPEGIRKAIDDGISAATGKYILRSDAHCVFSEGYDKALQENCEENWVVTLRRYPILIENNKMQALTNPPNPKIQIADYFYLSCPWTHPTNPPLLIMCPWFGKTRYTKEVVLDETMGMQGCVWFAHTNYCRDVLSNLGDNGLNFGDQTVIPLRVWLSGGRVVVNKDVWYAHPDSKNSLRGYGIGLHCLKDNMKESEYWVNDRYERRVHNFDWLIEKFWPLPLTTSLHYGEKYGWPEDWRKYYGTN